ncbi:MAG: squalene/phytoene synthase family protein [Akkermansiaceae bacterium]|nr:squalene/phytoene synthase family protein [Akkermansiaceae bacterium]
MPDSQEITRKAKSNLAFAFGVLPRPQREAMTSFYAFCRTIDDLADDESVEESRRRAALKAWKHGLEVGFEDPTPLQQEITAVRKDYSIPTPLLLAIIEGCEMDLEKTRYATWEELDGYIWKVACAVGLVSIRIFGCKSPESETYAEALGRALQITNILRDVGEDLRERDRIYLPLEDLHQFGYREEDLRSQVRDERYLQLMEFEATRAANYFEEAQLSLTTGDRRALRPARMMAEIYAQLLQRMRADGFRVFDKRYRVGKLEKLWIGLRHLF